MSRIDAKLLIQKLNNVSMRALEASVGTCMTRTHYEVTIDQYIATLMDRSDSDVAAIFKHFKINVAKLTNGIVRALEDLKTGNSGKPQWSPYLVDLFEAASLVSTLELGGTKIRSGALLIGLLRKPEVAVLTDYTDELNKIKEDELKKDFFQICDDSRENEVAEKPGAPGAAPSGAPGTSEALSQFTTDLTAQAKEGKIDPVIGREKEIRNVVDILMRRYQNNPLIVGDPGTGKTAIAEGFALRIANGDVPPFLHGVTLLSLDVGLLSAGASVKGEFERRLKQVIKEVGESNAAGKPIVLFIDEAHTLIGGGGAGNDASNLLKPALARGELRTIAATTWAEYKKYIEKDPPFAQRFGLIKLEEPSVEVCIEMLRGTKDKFESHHKVRILDEAVCTAVSMSNQYLSEQKLPRKAVSLLDTASARVAVGLNTTPGPLEDIRRRIIQLDTAIRAIERDAEAGHETDADDLEDMKKEREVERGKFDALDKRWKEEKELAGKVITLRDEIEAAGNGQARGADQAAAKDDAKAAKGDESVSKGDGQAAAEPAAAKRDPKVIRAELDEVTEKLDAFVGKQTPLVPLQADGDVVAQVLSDWTGIPAGNMVRDQARAILSFEERIGKRIIGQDPALIEIGKRLRIASGKLHDPVLPLAVLFLVGPSGNGKTETALGVADLIFGGERFLTSINMTEYSSSMNVSRLIGSAPGLVGFGEGGVLTEAVRQRPYSVVLLDEMEKAHMDVNLLFMQVFDKGQLNDSEGRVASFKNTVIIITSNEGSDLIMGMCEDPDELPSIDEMRTAIQPVLEQRFTPAFVGRTTVIPYYPLHPDTIRKIVDIKLDKIRQRLQKLYKIGLETTPAVGNEIGSRCTQMTTGARNINLIINETVLPEIARNILELMGSDKKPEKLMIDAVDGDFTYKFA
ncbi:MAG: type VI secretion system ATPase TssH [Planctomycetes bacterium]|nr:type VI secretion system ATPase TssH [Planctomycetota bacterium]